MGTLVPSCRGWKRLTAAVCAGLMAGAFSFLPVAEALRGGELPQGGISSTASITTNDGTMNITGAENNVIKWVSFSIGEGNAVKFDNKNYLNYVTGHARSEILGTLTGGGKIYLVNPNGILIGDNARIDVGNLYLSTRNLTADQLTDYATATGALFKAGDLNGDVINMGKLNADVITVEGNNITFKNVADVTKNVVVGEEITGQTLNDSVILAARGGEIHLGYEVGTEATEVNASQYTDAQTPTLDGWSFAGATHDYYMLVRNKYELQNMQNNLAGNYMLANDIDMSGVTNFTPIGNGEFVYGEDEDKNYFKGNFNGLEHEIRNLCINADDTVMCVGLFGVNSGTIRNVGLVGGSITGYAYVGSIAGQNTEGTIENVFNTGTVKSINSDNGTVGGIVGSNILGTIKNAYNTGAVTSTSWGGGIVAMNEGGTIENVFNTGAIAGVGTSNWLGGIVGQNDYGQIHDEPQYGGSPDIDPHMNQQVVDGTITNAYNTGMVTSNSATNSWVGGIAGQNNVYHPHHSPDEPSHMPDESSSSSNIKNVYNTGTVSGTGNYVFQGGIVGNGDRASNAYTSANGDLKKAATFQGFDFLENGAWRIYEDKTMPLLTAFMKKADNIVSIKYDETGTGDIGARYVATTYNNTEAQVGGANYISDVYVTLPVQSAPSDPEGGGSSGGSGGSGGSGSSGGSSTPTSPVNPSNPVAPVTPVNPVEPTPVIPAEPTPVNPAEPSSAAPGQAVTNPASGTLRPEGTLAERVIAEVEAGNLSLGTVTELENAAETAKEQSFAKDMAAVAEMGGAEANAPSPAAGDSGHSSYTMLDGGLVAVRDDVNSAPASAVMGSNPGRRNANEVMAAAEQADLTIGTEEVHNRQENSTVDEDSDEEDKKQSEQN